MRFPLRLSHAARIGGLRSPLPVYRRATGWRSFQRALSFSVGHPPRQHQPGATQQLVRAGRLELPASWSRTTRAANCAMPGYANDYSPIWLRFWSSICSCVMPIASNRLMTSFSGSSLSCARRCVEQPSMKLRWRSLKVVMRMLGRFLQR